jgi:hypothetical protein
MLPNTPTKSSTQTLQTMVTLYLVFFCLALEFVLFNYKSPSTVSFLLDLTQLPYLLLEAMLLLQLIRLYGNFTTLSKELQSTLSDWQSHLFVLNTYVSLYYWFYSRDKIQALPVNKDWNNSFCTELVHGGVLPLIAFVDLIFNKGSAKPKVADIFAMPFGILVVWFMLHNFWRVYYQENLHPEVDMGSLLECVNMLSFGIIFIMGGSLAKSQLNKLSACSSVQAEDAFGSDQDALDGKPIVEKQSWLPKKKELYTPELEEYVKKRDHFLKKDVYGDQKKAGDQERVYPTDQKNK